MTHHAVITGAAGGLGRAVALRLAAETSGHITLVDYRAEETQAVAREVAELTESKIHILTADLSEPNTAVSVIQQAWETAEITELVNAAGIYPSHTVEELTAEAWLQVLNINTTAPVLSTAELARLWSSHSESVPETGVGVVNISSTAAGRSRPGATAYSASKAALESATKTAALELGAQGIRVNAVAPGFVAVDSSVNPLAEEYVRTVDENPLGRSGTPEDIAEAVAWLLGPQTSWVTGSVVTVDGGSSVGNRRVPLAQ